MVDSSVNVYFGENLEILRKKSGMSQKEFAEAVDITEASFTSYKKGDVLPNGKVFVRLVQKFNINLNDMLFKKGYGDPEIESMSIAAEEAEEYLSEVKQMKNQISQLLEWKTKVEKIFGESDEAIDNVIKKFKDLG